MHREIHTSLQSTIEQELARRGLISIASLVVVGSGMSESFAPGELDVLDTRIGSTVDGHPGEMALWHREEGATLVSLGRLHLYEGYTTREVGGLVEVAASLGARHLVLTNAAGGLDPRFDVGDIMAITGTLSLMLGARAALTDTDISASELSHRGHEPFDIDATRSIVDRAAARGIALREGVYAGVLGPSYETRAEIGLLRLMGASAVGMSTVVEAAVAQRLGMSVVGFSLITNRCSDTRRVELSHDEVVEQGLEARERMRNAIEVAMMGIESRELR